MPGGRRCGVPHTALLFAPHVLNNPYTYNDPSGHQEIVTDTLIVVSLVVVVAVLLAENYYANNPTPTDAIDSISQAFEDKMQQIQNQLRVTTAVVASIPELLYKSATRNANGQYQSKRQLDRVDQLNMNHNNMNGSKGRYPIKDPGKRYSIIYWLVAGGVITYKIINSILTGGCGETSSNSPCNPTSNSTTTSTSTVSTPATTTTTPISTPPPLHEPY
jgi:hypothetical protein